MRPSALAILALAAAATRPAWAGEANVTCPAHAVPGLDPPASVADCVCREGHFGGGADGCAACPAHCECLWGARRPVAEPGFWVAPSEPTAVLRCAGGRSACVGDSACGEGYAGRACDDCADGGVRSGLYCTDCSALGAAHLLLLLVLVVGLLVVAPCYQASSRRQFGTAGRRPLRRKMFSVIAIAALPLQAILFLLRQPLPTLSGLFVETYHVFAVAWLDFGVASCRHSVLADRNSDFGPWRAVVALPVFLVGCGILVTAAYVLAAVVYAKAPLPLPLRTCFAPPPPAILDPDLLRDADEPELGGDRPRHSFRAWARGYVGTLVFDREGLERLVRALAFDMLAFFCVFQMPLLATALDLLECVPVDGGASHVLLSRPSVACYTDEWRALRPYAALAAVWYGLGPIMALAAYYQSSTRPARGPGKYQPVSGSSSGASSPRGVRSTSNRSTSTVHGTPLSLPRPGRSVSGQSGSSRGRVTSYSMRPLQQKLIRPAQMALALETSFLARSSDRLSRDDFVLTCAGRTVHESGQLLLCVETLLLVVAVKATSTDATTRAAVFLVAMAAILVANMRFPVFVQPVEQMLHVLGLFVATLFGLYGALAARDALDPEARIVLPPTLLAALVGWLSVVLVSLVGIVRKSRARQPAGATPLDREGSEADRRRLFSLFTKTMSLSGFRAAFAVMDRELNHGHRDLGGYREMRIMGAYLSRSVEVAAEAAAAESSL